MSCNPRADACVGAVVYYLWGYGLAYDVGCASDSSYKPNGFIGWGCDNFALSGVETARATGTTNGTKSPDPWITFFFQYAFAAAAATIVSGAVAERCQLLAYLIYTTFITGFIYPVVVHWVWDSAGFLSGLNKDAMLSGVIDFAGSGVVHMTGGWAALMGAMILGPRIGRWTSTKPWEFEGHSSTLQVLGTFILWFGWCVCRQPPRRARAARAPRPREARLGRPQKCPLPSTGTGSTRARRLGSITKQPPSHALRCARRSPRRLPASLVSSSSTSSRQALAATASSISPTRAAVPPAAHWRRRERGRAARVPLPRPTGPCRAHHGVTALRSCNSILGGLVGVTAGCATVPAWASVVIGLVSAFVYHGASCTMRKAQIDDPLDAWAVHGACGAWGMIAVGLFTDKTYSYVPAEGNPNQIGDNGKPMGYDGERLLRRS